LDGTNELLHEDWLQIHKQGIGRSDAVDLNPQKSRLVKTSRDIELPKVDSLDEESPMCRGNVPKLIVAWHCSKRMKNHVRRRINAYCSTRTLIFLRCQPILTVRKSWPLSRRNEHK